MTAQDSGYSSGQSLITKSFYKNGATRDDPFNVGRIIGAQYNSTNPTYTDGQWGNLQIDSRGRLKCIMEGATIDIAGDLQVDVSAFTDTSGNQADAVIFTDDEDLSTATNLVWQGVGGYDSTNDRFRSLNVDEAGSVIMSESGTAPSQFRSTTVDETASQNVKATAGSVYGWNIYNPNGYDIFVKLYNALTGDVTVGTTAIVETIHVPALGSVMVKSDQPIISFSTAIGVAATKLYADSDTTALDTDAVVKIYYK